MSVYIVTSKYLQELTHFISLTPNINTFQKSQNHWWWGNDCALIQRVRYHKRVNVLPIQQFWHTNLLQVVRRSGLSTTRWQRGHLRSSVDGSWDSLSQLGRLGGDLSLIVSMRSSKLCDSLPVKSPLCFFFKDDTYLAVVLTMLYPLKFSEVRCVVSTILSAYVVTAVTK